MTTTTPLLLSRTCDPLADLDHLLAERAVLDAYAIDRGPIWHYWESALALHAVERWRQARGREPKWPIYVIGAEEDFIKAAIVWCGEPGLMTLRTEDTRAGELAIAGAPLADVTLCLSVLEHVDDLDRYLFELSCLVAPGGLLGLTLAYWNRCGADRAEGWQARQRIFCPASLGRLRATLAEFGLSTFGGFDPAWHGATRTDYSIASLVLEKRS